MKLELDLNINLNPNVGGLYKNVFFERPDSTQLVDAISEAVIKLHHQLMKDGLIDKAPRFINIWVPPHLKDE